ncbi:40S ribosomal protein S27 [Lobosporangium transversale]|uniref:40S ribosomal protein S27 n=1 Tax=Lobosporangium transversale TaxID=64571 RepID=A0A1Y2GZP6_9FUNG|nr:ribosomal protein S27 [Lobosporangium transversale]KAF9898481.1 40S ribosomal protein S27 [Lobosporangium transversale]ORZ26943.1 ribosomal protein S27 [Lobosporangium transversale]|eukprot:XP_021884690.1 ribosomal protein S27 [Lobosporangium transversale]
MTLAYDLLNPTPLREAQTHKLKRVVQSPDSFYMDVKCSACQTITPLFSHAATVVSCPKCSTVLAQPTGGRARLSEGVSFRKKAA